MGSAGLRDTWRVWSTPVQVAKMSQRVIPCPYWHRKDAFQNDDVPGVEPAFIAGLKKVSFLMIVCMRPNFAVMSHKHAYEMLAGCRPTRCTPIIPNFRAPEIPKN